MQRQKLIVVLIFFFSAITLYYLYDEIANWAELGEMVRYAVLGLPLAVILSLLSYKNLKFEYKNKKVISVMGFVAAAILATPPVVIYYLIHY